MATSFYRADYLSAHMARWQGEILLARRPHFTLIALLAALAIAMFVAVAALGAAPRRVTVSGIVTPTAGLVELAPRSSGVLVETKIKEGDRVEAGDPLFEIRTDTDAGAGSIARMVSSTIRVRRTALQDELRARAAQYERLGRILDAKSGELAAQIEAIGREERLTEQRIELSRRVYERFGRLASGGFISETQHQAKQEELLDWETRGVQTERASRALQGQQRELDAERATARAQFESESASLRRAIQATDQELLENEYRSREIVSASRAGRITSVNVTPGSSVRPQQVLAVLVPSEADRAATPPLEAVLHVPSRGAGFVSVGQDVWLRYAAFPYQKFGQQKGRVVHVDDSPTPLEDLPSMVRASVASSRPTIEPLYRVRVMMVDPSLSAGSQRLNIRAGMLLEADVIQERRSILEWVFEPLLATRQRFSS